jgi:hypothetical protein
MRKSGRRSKRSYESARARAVRTVRYLLGLDPNPDPAHINLLQGRA